MRARTLSEFFYSMASRLPNYLISNRKRLALSQKDVAYLLGAETESQVSRYENFLRLPGLERSLACEIIFQRAVCDLFVGVYERVDVEIRARAAKLLEAKVGVLGVKAEQRLKTLKRLAGENSSMSEKS
jgi:transcriptional regulator with XRE-family HTH domain